MAMVSSVTGSPMRQRFFQLALFIRGRELAELLSGEIALAEIETRFRVPGESHFDPPELSIERRVGRVIPDDVVAGNGFLGVHDAHREVVEVEKGLAARIGGQRVESVLRALETRQRRQADAPVYMPAPPCDPLMALPSGEDAVRPRASTGQNETPARIASLMVARSCA